MRFGVVVLIGFLLCGDISARTYRELNTPIVTTNSSGNAISSEAMTDKSPEIVYHRNQTVGNNEVVEYEEIDLDPELRQSVAKQIGLPANPVGLLVSRVPCNCVNGVCACCTGFLLSAFRSKGCMNITYVPEEFAFEVKMMMNDAVLYKRRMSGRNPRPICVSPPRLGFIELCANFYDIYFNGRNMHLCLDMDAKFQGYQLYSRSFDCMRLGDQGVKIVKPGDDSFLPASPAGGTDAEVDAGDEEIEDYDELLSRQIS